MLLRPMTIDDYDAVVALWQTTEGVGLNESDSREGIESYLGRNPELSLVVEVDSEIVAAVLCGHDGRRGFLNHLAVARPFRGQGLGRRLVEACLGRLGPLGILKCNIYLYVDNAAGAAFWRHLGWQDRAELKVMQ
ncbi:MAG TPA: GNAT family N-acetyltransferase, partial [Pirellulales bacterium]|nr:GNAT family N-acetyltransferase [Pirellulales bacterium]